MLLYPINLSTIKYRLIYQKQTTLRSSTCSSDPEFLIQKSDGYEFRNYSKIRKIYISLLLFLSRQSSVVETIITTGFLSALCQALYIFAFIKLLFLSLTIEIARGNEMMLLLLLFPCA